MEVISSDRQVSLQHNEVQLQNYPFEPIEFSKVSQLAHSFADHIQDNFDELAEILLTYESFEVVEDEAARTLDILRNLKEDKDYFVRRTGQITAFLPRNQPLYALTCFVIVPSLMATEVHMRIPYSMRNFFPKLVAQLKLTEFFPNIFISHKERINFLCERSALQIDPETEESTPVTDAVIFTGTPYHAEKLRLVFDQRTLFIANGSGHNPVIVSKDADVKQAVEATLTLQLYNQGQDCAAPNAILVHSLCFNKFLNELRKKLSAVKVGHYHDRSCRVGPISDPDDVKRIQALLIDNREWLDKSAPGIVRTSEAIVEPTIICKPLVNGGNFSEVFAPIIFLQEYVDDADLVHYFEHPHYARNAMYTSLYGTSNYIDKLIGKLFSGKLLHDQASVLRNIHLHIPGVERGTQPYGGYGYAASSYSINGQIICKPTLPQRDIFENLVKPFLHLNENSKSDSFAKKKSKLLVKDVSKLLGLKIVKNEEDSKEFNFNRAYIDASDIISRNGERYVPLTPEKIFSLLEHPNAEYIAKLEPKHLHQIRALKKYLEEKENMTLDDLTQFLYSVAKREDRTPEENKEEQLAFFKNVYHLLFGKKSGPRLAQFLCDANKANVLSLLHV